MFLFLFFIILFFLFFFFFFQAEDGIRDRDVTGVQTCALPIFHRTDRRRSAQPVGWARAHSRRPVPVRARDRSHCARSAAATPCRSRPIATPIAPARSV